MASSFEVDYFEVEPYDDPYVRTPLEWCRARMQWEDLGMLTWLRSHQAGFQFTESFIINASPAGRDKVRAILRRLETAGYLKRTKIRDEEGRIRGAKLALRATADPVVAALRAAKRTEPSTENPSLDVEQREHPDSGVPQVLPTEKPSEVDEQEQHSVSAGEVLKTGLPTLANPQQRKNIFKEPPPPTPSSGPEPGDAAVVRAEEAEELGKFQAAAESLAASLPGTLTSGQRYQLIEPIAARLAAGWEPEALTAELTVDLNSVRSYNGLYRHRLAKLPAAPPDPVETGEVDETEPVGEKHPFDPDTTDPETCRRCPRPEANRIHARTGVANQRTRTNAPDPGYGHGSTESEGAQARSGRRTSGPFPVGAALGALLARAKADQAA